VNVSLKINVQAFLMQGFGDEILVYFSETGKISFCCRDGVKNQLLLQKLSATLMFADVMNKVLVGKLFRVFVAKIMGHEVTATDRTECRYY